MERKRPGKPEQYNVIISSETDARKRPAAFKVKQRTLVAAVIGLILVVAISAGLTVMSIFQASEYYRKVQTLKNQADMHSSILDAYSGEIDALRAGIKVMEAESGLQQER